MASKSGIAMIEELLKKVDVLSKKVDVLDRNVKKIANSAKIAEIATNALDTPLKDWAIANNAKAKPKQIKPISQEEVGKEKMRFKFEQTKKPEICICEGKIVLNDGPKAIPLASVNVKIYNEMDRLVKETKTNRAGKWMSNLKPGKYVALYEGEFRGQALYPMNINFEVKPGMEKLEIN